MFWNQRLTEYLKEQSKQINYLTESDKHNVWLFDQMTSKIKELEENTRLLYEFLGVHKEVVNDTFLVEDDCPCCEDMWEEIEEDKKNSWGTGKGVTSSLKDKKK